MDEEIPIGQGMQRCRTPNQKSLGEDDHTSIQDPIQRESAIGVLTQNTYRLICLFAF